VFHSASMAQLPGAGRAWATRTLANIGGVRS
jgi:hypothetical protein